MTSRFWERIDPADAEIVRRHLSSYPIKVGELARDLGVNVIRSPLPPKVSGLIRPSTESQSGFEIRVNKYEVPERQRFTVAHEIAHYLLHRDNIGSGVIDNIMYRSNLTSKKETDANQLAAEIIMPKKYVAHELQRVGGERAPQAAEKLAAIFRVSVPAMKIRIGIS